MEQRLFKILINSEKSYFSKLFCSLLVCIFLLTQCFFIAPVQAQSIDKTLLSLPPAGTMVSVSQPFNPVLIKGITVYPDNPFRFDFIMSEGDVILNDVEFKLESTRLIKYFLTALTIPEGKMWVNLSPYEHDRIVSEELGKTEAGRDLLSLDYMLKQLASTLMYPEELPGSGFWEKIHSIVGESFSSEEIPVDTFNKIWIAPEKAVISIRDNNVFIVESRLKVMLEEDYVAASKGQADDAEVFRQKMQPRIKELLKSTIIPIIEKEINEGKNFSQLRQIYHSFILAAWYKENLKASTL